MDRAAVYLGQVPRSLDILSQGQNSMVGLAKLSEAVLGTSTVVAGFPITATSTPSLNINVGAGQVYQVSPLEATQLSGLAPDVHQIVKQGLTLDPTTLTLAPPTSVGTAVNVLIEVGYADVDTAALVLTFQNPSAPGTTYQGPGGNGQASNTVRKGVAQVRPVYGTPTTAGQQTTPVPDAGFVGIAVVTLTFGQTTITSTNVAPYNSNANYIPTPLTGVPSGVQSGAWVVGYATPAGTTAGTAPANTYSASLFTTSAFPFTLTPGMEILVYFGTGNTNTSPVLNVNGTGNLPMLRQGGGTPAIANATNGLPADISGWVPFILRADKGAWLINGLVPSDIAGYIGSQTRINAPGPITLYVRTDGSDNGNGSTNTSAGAGGANCAFLTLQAAYNYLTQKFNPGFTATIQLGIQGTYAGFVAYNNGVTGQISVVGDGSASGSAQTSYIITPITYTTGYVCVLSTINVVQLQGLTLDASSLSNGQYCNMARAGGNGVLSLGNVTLRAATTNPNISMLEDDTGSTINLTGNITLSGTSVGAAIASFGNFAVTLPAGVTINVSNMTFSTAFAVVSGGYCNLNLVTFSGSNNTGSKYIVNNEGVFIPPNSGSAAGIASIPGSVAGTALFGQGVAAGDTGVPWAQISPGITSTGGAFTTAAAFCRFQRYGKWVAVQIQLNISTVGNASGGIVTQLPITPTTNISLSGCEIAQTGKTVSTRPNNSSGQILVSNYDNSSPIVAGGQYLISGIYEAQT